MFPHAIRSRRVITKAIHWPIVARRSLADLLPAGEHYKCECWRWRPRSAMKLSTCAGLLFVAVYCVANIDPNEGNSSGPVIKSRKKRHWGITVGFVIAVGAGMFDVF